MTNVLVLHGPNLNLTGSREPQIYGTTSLKEINEELRRRAQMRGAELQIVQSNHEGVLIDSFHEAVGWADGALCNAGALTHYSFALRDAIAAVAYPVVETHLSLPASREAFRHISVIAPVCIATVAGFGPHSYVLAMEGLLHRLGGHS